MVLHVQIASLFIYLMWIITAMKCTNLDIMDTFFNSRWRIIPLLCIFCGWEPDDDWAEFMEVDPYVIQTTVTNDEHVTRALRVVELKRKRRELEKQIEEINRELREYE